MIQKLVVSLLFIFFANAITVQAQLNFNGLDDLWKFAQKNNRQIGVASDQLYISEIQIKQAKGRLLPVASLNGTFTDNITIQPTLVPASLFNPAAPANTFNEVLFGKRYNYNASISASVGLLNTENRSALQTARISKEMAEAILDKTKTTLHSSIAETYYSIVLLREAGRLTEMNVKTTTVLYTLALSRYKEGMISEQVLNKAIINKQKTENSLASIKLNNDLLLENLKVLLGTTDSIHLNIEPELEAGSPETGLFTLDPDVKIADKDLQLALTNLKAAQTAFLPIISLVYSGNVQITSEQALKFTGSNSLPQQFWGIRLSFPLYSGNTRRLQVQKARKEIQIKEKEYDRFRQESAVNDENLLKSFRTSFNAYKKAAATLALYQRNDYLSEQKLMEGYISLEERLNVYNELLINQQEYLQFMKNYYLERYLLHIRQTATE